MLKSNTLKTTCYTILIAKHHQYLKKRYLYVHTNNYLMDDEWSPILCDCDGFLTSGQNRCPLPSTDLLSGHRASTLPWDLSPFKVNSLKITSVCFKTNLFGYLRGDSLLSDFCDNFFPRPRDTKMMSLWLY